MTSRDGTVYAARSLRRPRLRRALGMMARLIGYTALLFLIGLTGFAGMVGGFGR